MLTVDHIGNLRKLAPDEIDRQIKYLRRLRNQLQEVGASGKADFFTITPIMDVIDEMDHLMMRTLNDIAEGRI